MFLKNFAVVLSALGTGLAFTPQPPVGQQVVQGGNLNNLSQTMFFSAQSKTLTNGAPDCLQLSFQIGAAFDPSFAPSEYYIVVSGSKAGIGFADYLLAPGDRISTTNNNGNWGLGSYIDTHNWTSAFTQVESRAQKIVGAMALGKSIGPPAWGCGFGLGTSMEALITDSSTAAEIAMYKGTNWGHFATGDAHVIANVNGTILDFSGPFEAETTYGPPYQDIYSRFIYDFAKVGPFAVVLWHVAPAGEPTKWATIGYLAHNGRLIVNECNRVDQRPLDTTKITPTGTRKVQGLTFPMPQGLDIEFTDKHGKKNHFKFNTAGEIASPLPIGNYINTLGTVTGGRLGCKQYTGSGQFQFFATPGNDFS